MDNYLEKVLSLKGENRISGIIPAWNESKNISKVLEVIDVFPAFDEILVVDDGSEDDTAEIALKFSNVKLIRHEVNQGKTAAVLTGIKNSSGDLIVLIDADLVGLTEENIAKMIYYLLSGNCDLAILDRAGDRSAIWGWTNCARFFSGERAFWKKDFLEINLPQDGGYLLEVIMNLHYIERKKKIQNIYCPNLYTVHQYDKFGTLQGYKNYLNTAVKIVRKAKIKGFIKQISTIETDYRAPRRIKLPDWPLKEYYEEWKEKGWRK